MMDEDFTGSEKEGGDAPLIDLNEASIKKLIARAKRRGVITVDELNEAHGTGLPEERYDTVGGFVFGALGRVPRTGEGVSHGGWRLTVEAMDGRRIQQVRIAREVR